MYKHNTYIAEIKQVTHFLKLLIGAYTLQQGFTPPLIQLILYQ